MTQDQNMSSYAFHFIVTLIISVLIFPKKVLIFFTDAESWTGWLQSNTYLQVWVLFYLYQTVACQNCLETFSWNTLLADKMDEAGWPNGKLEIEIAML